MAQAQSNGVALPGDSNKKGALNNTNTPEMKNPVKVDESALDSGPNVDAATKSYLPASYRTNRGAIRTDN